MIGTSHHALSTIFHGLFHSMTSEPIVRLPKIIAEECVHEILETVPIAVVPGGRSSNIVLSHAAVKQKVEAQIGEGDSLMIVNE
jgi:hypothetical protein